MWYIYFCMINSFATNIDDIELPKSFPSPFADEPHPLCVVAADELKAVIAKQNGWRDELEAGKMFGVLVVRCAGGALGYLAAFSGNMAGSNHHPNFVPPVYDLLNPDGFFKIEEQEITDINRQVAEIESDGDFKRSVNDLELTIIDAGREIAASSAKIRERKEKREAVRALGCDAGTLAEFVRESQHDKAEHKRLQRRLDAVIDEKKRAVNVYSQRLNGLQERRRMLSSALQMKIFDCFGMLNAKGHIAGLPAIFAPSAQGVPPAGAGECAGPKLLQYAFANNLTPICMAEFWWGSSPKSVIRHHGRFYPACKGKCEPILNYMLQGLNVDDAQRNHHRMASKPLDIVYEDEWIVVINKPAGMLSVPARGESDSVLQRLISLYPDATGPLLVHRLDMETSGLLIAAKTGEAYRHLQAQFEMRQVKKKYVAVVDGVVVGVSGEVSLPLSADYINRPMQMVDFEKGKEAISIWRVIERIGNRTVVELNPVTGRTHQLRVHCAHKMGLGCPVVGDELYGQRAERLYLHAAKVEFVHPYSNNNISFNVEVPFRHKYPE